MNAYAPPKANKYLREVKPGVMIDVYDVLQAWRVENPALQHLIKYSVTGSSLSCHAENFDEDHAKTFALEEAEVKARELNNYWLAGLRTLTTEAAAEAAIAKLG